MDVKPIFAEEVLYGGCFGTDNSLNNTLDTTKLQPNTQFFIPIIEDVSALDINVDQYNETSTVRTLHKSIINKDYCFELNTPDGIKWYKCSSDGERQYYIEKLKRKINPELDNLTRTENHIIIYVQELKNIQTKKKYFCEICLDKKLCAKTTAKVNNDSSILWGEGFEFTSHPINESITVHLYKGSKKKKDKDYVGLVNISARKIKNSPKFIESWYILSTPSGNNKNKLGNQIALRLKVKIVNTNVLPLHNYEEFNQFFLKNYLKVCTTLQNCMTSVQKDEFSKMLVNIMTANGVINNFICDLVFSETSKTEEESLVMRGNTIGTKSIEFLLRLYAMKYLNQTFGGLVESIFEMKEDCECDIQRLHPVSNIKENQQNLIILCEMAIGKVCNSVGNFPHELRTIFSRLTEKLTSIGRPRIAFRVVTASLFLRLLCPSILNPILFDLADEIPGVKVSRTLTLVAKVLQNLANRSRFSDKEEYMGFMDYFIRTNGDKLTMFIQNITDIELSLDAVVGFEGCIDLGNELAKLHMFLVNLFESSSVDSKTYAYLRPLPSILHDISQQLEVPEIKTVGLSKVSNEANSFKAKQKQNSNIVTPNTLPLVLDEQNNRKDEDKKNKADYIPDNEVLDLSYRSENEFFSNEQEFEQIVNKLLLDSTGSFDVSNENKIQKLSLTLKNIKLSFRNPVFELKRKTSTVFNEAEVNEDTNYGFKDNSYEEIVLDRNKSHTGSFEEYKPINLINLRSSSGAERSISVESLQNSRRTGCNSCYSNTKEQRLTKSESFPKSRLIKKPISKTGSAWRKSNENTYDKLFLPSSFEHSIPHNEDFENHYDSIELDEKDVRIAYLESENRKLRKIIDDLKEEIKDKINHDSKT